MIIRTNTESPSSNSSISSAEVKRAKKINYFHGNGKKKWDFKKEWIVDSVNLTKELDKFRRRSIVQVEKDRDINSLRILALSHVFPVNQFDSTRSIAPYFDDATRTALKSAANHLKPTVKLGPAKALLYCQREANLANSIFKSVGEDEQDNEDDEDDEDAAKMAIIKDVSMQLKQNRASIVQSSEVTFAEKYLMPIIRRVLLENTKQEMIYAMIDKPIKSGKKPDFMIGTEYQPEDDFAKLMKLLKRSIDDQLQLGVETPTSLGLLVEGFKCTLFQMRLVGVYMPIAFSRFSLVEEQHQMVLLPSVIDAFCFIKVMF
ncbi:hypothetical protein FB192DRAFT_1428943 [Mucor lusitanicus]|uniref:Uncharacterized protein n=1 Tax=Mucor circinelloides f. lusitanicus TaxID=29924 RepID=A0A8H4BG56_MUCCL|nr:hypothetical protein FB192DRAFT_1428943 [Mucor lusitanicus]